LFEQGTLKRKRQNCRESASQSGNSTGVDDVWRSARCAGSHRSALASRLRFGLPSRPMPMPPDPPSRWRGLLLARALALVETQAPIDDSAELAAAHRAADDLTGRVLARAWPLAEREGLRQALDGLVRNARRLALLGLLLVALSAGGMLQAVLGSGRQINLVFALVPLLGLHALTLLLWLASLPWRPQGGGIGHWVWRLDAQFASPPQRALLAAGLELLQQGGLGRWLFGAISHGLWALTFIVVLACLAAAFSLQAYALSWETTILTSQQLLAFIEGAGRWPAWLGLPVASPQALLAAEPAERHRLLAWWLLSGVLAWGLLPRVLAWGVCLTLARWRARRLALDPTAPWVRQLASRFAALQAAQVLDPEQAAVRPPPRPAGLAIAGPLAVVGFELPPEAPWPPPATPPAALCQRIDGSGDEQQQLLQALAQHPPGSVLLVLNGSASPDRGTARFIEALRGGTRALALLLQADAGRMNAGRWSDWLAASQLGEIPVFTTADAARRWATGGHAAPEASTR